MAGRETVGHILVVDDERGIRDLVTDVLESAGHEVTQATGGSEALTLLDGRAVDLVISDVRMPAMDGIELLARIRNSHPGLPVILLTAFGTIPQAVEAIRLGAFDFLEKPIRNPRSLRGIVARALSHGDRPADPTPGPLPDFVCEDPASKDVLDLLERVAPRDTTVLVTGESGTGKEVAARWLHARSRRAPGPFVASNVAAMASNLVEDQLFGHERGAFTGATSAREGLFEAADGGTLFLDEIGEMALELQAKILRIIETQSFQRLGSTHVTEVDVRLVAATNRDLKRAVREGRFREDLYYRLGVFPVHIPPLRDRPVDILPLAEHFLHAITEGAGPRELTPEAEGRLLAHTWPGNVRELRNVVERALVLTSAPRIDADHLVFDRPGTESPPVGGTLKDMERRAVLSALEKAGGNRKQAAEILGISLRSLQYKIKDYGLKKR